jgi:hypothetical protein
MVGIAVLASLALFPEVGEADFGGTLMAVEGTTVDITPATLIDSTAVTISYLNLKESKVRHMDVATIIPGGPSATMPLTITKNTSRVYIELDHSLDGVGSQVTVTQGTTIISRDLLGSGRLVFDVVPVP